MIFLVLQAYDQALKQLKYQKYDYKQLQLGDLELG